MLAEAEAKIREAEAWLALAAEKEKALEAQRKELEEREAALLGLRLTGGGSWTDEVGGKVSLLLFDSYFEVLV